MSIALSTRMAAPNELYRLPKSAAPTMASPDPEVCSVRRSGSSGRLSAETRSDKRGTGVEVTTPMGTAAKFFADSSAGRSTTSRDYERHLAEARRRDLTHVAATRALYVAGEDDRGNQLVIFAPDLIRGLPTSNPGERPARAEAIAQRMNSKPSAAPAAARECRHQPYSGTNTDEGLMPFIDDLDFSITESADGGLAERPDQGGVSCPDTTTVIHGYADGRGLATSRASAATVTVSAAKVTASGAAPPPVQLRKAVRDEPAEGLEQLGASAVAGQSNVGSAAMESLLLYFVLLMDDVAHRDYSLLLCAGDKGGAPTGEHTTGGDGGWVTWGRFSLLGQMHSLLPRRYKKNLKGLVILQPTAVLHTFFDFAKLFLSPKFYRKLEFCGGFEELSERFSRNIIKALPEGVLTDAQSDGERSPSGGVSFVEHGTTDDPDSARPYRGDDDRPSPLRVVRVFGGGLQVQGDENWTPPPMPPPPLKPAPALSPPRSGGSTIASTNTGRSANKGRSQRTSLDKRVSTNSGAGPNTPSPRRPKSLHITATSVGGPFSGGTSSTAPPSRPHSKTPSGTSSGVSFSPATKGEAGGVTSSAPRSSAIQSPSFGRKSSSESSPGGGMFAGVLGGHTTSFLDGVCEGDEGVRANRGRLAGSAPTYFHRRTAGSVELGAAASGAAPLCSTPGGGVSGSRVAGSGGLDRGKGSRRAGGVSPQAAKTVGVRRSSAGNAAASSWFASADRASPRPSPRGAVTPRGTAIRGTWGGSPASGKRSGPPTPSPRATASSTGRKVSRTASLGQQLQQQQAGFGQLGGGAAANAIAMAAGTGRSRSALQHAAPGRSERAPEMRAPGSSQKIKATSPMPLRTKSPRHMPPAKSPRQPLQQSARSPSHPTAGKSPKHQAGKSPRQPSRSSPRATGEGWGSELYHKAGIRGDESEIRKRYATSSSRQALSRRPSHESPRGTSTRASSSVVDSAQLAALEREVKSRGARVATLAAAGVTRSYLPAGETGRGGAGAGAGGGGGGGGGGVGGSRHEGECGPADHPAPLRRTSVGSQGTKSNTRARAASTSNADTGGARGSVNRQHLTTSARIAPGIQALIANYRAAALALPAPGTGTHKSPPKAVSASGLGPFASVGLFPATSKDHDTTGRADSAGDTPKAHRSPHLMEAGDMRRALREHTEALRKAAAAGSVARMAGALVRERGSNTAIMDIRTATPRRRVLPDPKGKVFGVPLVELMDRTPGEDVPWVLKRFIGYLSKFGLESVGLFRLAGDGLDRKFLREALDAGKQVCWDPDEDVEGEDDCLVLTDVNMVAQLLKAFFRELPEPLLPFSAYGTVVAIAKAAGGANARWVQAMKGILWRIPNANYKCLRVLFEFLQQVASHSSINRMTSENLAIVWAPNLLRPQNDDPFETLRDLRFQIETVRWMVDRFDELFGD